MFNTIKKLLARLSCRRPVDVAPEVRLYPVYDRNGKYLLHIQEGQKIIVPRPVEIAASNGRTVLFDMIEFIPQGPYESDNGSWYQVDWSI